MLGGLVCLCNLLCMCLWRCVLLGLDNMDMWRHKSFVWVVSLCMVDEVPKCNQKLCPGIARRFLALLEIICFVSPWTKQSYELWAVCCSFSKVVSAFLCPHGCWLFWTRWTFHGIEVEHCLHVEACTSLLCCMSHCFNWTHACVWLVATSYALNSTWFCLCDFSFGKNCGTRLIRAIYETWYSHLLFVVLCRLVVFLL